MGVLMSPGNKPARAGLRNPPTNGHGPEPENVPRRRQRRTLPW
jgi:hypothetical protein